MSLRRLMVVFAALLVVGCRPHEETRGHYDSFGGTVERRSPDSGRILVRVSEPKGNKWTGHTLECVVTSDSEIYLNDRSTNLWEIAERDSVQVVGYFDRNEADQFTVTLANVTRPTPPPPLPVLAAPTTRPTSAPHQEAGSDQLGVDSEH